ncbi:hypothetical protein VCHC17A1_4045B, partial [Vibrio cholerae HC-17A1]
VNLLKSPAETVVQRLLSVKLNLSHTRMLS